MMKNHNRIISNNLINNSSNPYNFIIKHFQNLYNTQASNYQDYTSIPIGTTVPNNHIEALIAPVLDEKIKNVIYSSPNGSSPGPDGFSFEFYKEDYHIIGPKVCNVIKYFFNNDHLPKVVKATSITLIPKSTHNDSINNYRLICLCNSFYKIITKMLSIRI